jgi:hypothetical protein
MNRDDIIRMAMHASLGNALLVNSIDGERIYIEGADWDDEVMRFAALVAAAEREACERDIEDCRGGDDCAGYSNGISTALAAIRARGEK